MNIRKIIFFIFMILCITIKIFGEGAPEIKEIHSGSIIEGTDIVLVILPGLDWIHLRPHKSAPAFAVWIEDENGNYIETIYVTEKAAKQNWTFAKGNRRIEALPYWAYSRGVVYDDGLYLPDKKNPLPDTITSVTPRAKSSIFTKIPDKNIIIYLEINHSYDWNETYPRDLPEDDILYTECNGQPSLIYSCTINYEELLSGREFSLIPVGTGHIRGEDGFLTPGTDTLTTALEIIETVTVKIKNKEL